MPEQKSFWKRYEFFIIAVITLVFIYLLVFFNQKLNFFLGNELIIDLTPQQESFSMHYGEISKAEFDVSIDNVAYCKAACSYFFNDRSANDIIDKGNFEIQKGSHFKRSYDLNVKRLGSGQDIYSFEVKCRSIRAFLCLTKGTEKSRSSLVTANYDLTETEKELKRLLKQNVTKLLGFLSDVDIAHQQLNQKYFELAHKVNLNKLSKEKIDINDAYDKTRISIENLRSLWAVENYIKLDQLFNEGNFFEVLENIQKSIESLDQKINNIIKIHNDLLFKLKNLYENLNKKNSLKVSGYEFGTWITWFDFSKIEKFNVILHIDKLNKISSLIANNTFDDYESISTEILNLSERQNLLFEEAKFPSLILFFKLQYSFIQQKDLLCNLKQNCRDLTPISNLIDSTTAFMEKEYGHNSEDLEESCNLLEKLNLDYEKTRNETLNPIKDKNLSLKLDSELLKTIEIFKQNEIRKLNNSYYDSYQKIKSENKTNATIIRIADLILSINYTQIVEVQYNESLNITRYILSEIQFFNESLILLDICEKLRVPLVTPNFDFTPISPNISYEVVSKINTNLSDNPPICCIFNECKPCCRDESCRNNPKTFPVIFLHGHSFAKDNSPEFSLDSFNKLQSRLQDDGYLNAGIVSLYSKNEPLQAGVWGLSGKPVTIKASYYFDAFRKEDKYIVVPTKSENIDTYALRLKDLIELVKERTDKPKVNIIAHSMGGLVARRYIQIFGEEDINKLAMIATPNRGLVGAIGDYCGFIGENRECQDMQSSSLFINKLNDPSKQPSKVRLYAIIGQGCGMKLGDGDGIVLLENAKLENAKLFFINGTCGGLFGGVLHTEILDIENYLETYKVIREILRE
ncbi:MAG: hypothetical protein Q8R04_02060 [Nanoarchaeota archaeon]|nr:hypothetical protein [Nanoarchaeota archaeon]